MQAILPHKIRKAREAAHLNQGAFARAVGLSSEYISLLEAGKRTPSMATLEKIAGFLNRDLSYFFQEKPAPPDPFALLFRAEAVDEKTRAELQRFRRYCDDYVRLENLTGRRLETAPFYSGLSPERMADEERRRLGLGDEPIRDVFALLETNGCRLYRMPLPEDSKVSGVFLYLEQKEAAFALINSGGSPGRQVFHAAHEYCHYLKDRFDGPVIDGPDVFIDEYASLYHPREPFAQAFAARFLMPPGKIKEIIEKDFRASRLAYDHVLYLKRYFGVGASAMLRTLRTMSLVSAAQYDEFVRIDPGSREKDLFGRASGEDPVAGWPGTAPGGEGEERIEAGAASGTAGPPARIKRKPVPSDRYRMLQKEAIRKIARDRELRKAVQGTLPT
jgi:Zn-dependent peptidase ImmA (M78 family)/DNA-binding XRE family transcriptional regulator